MKMASKAVSESLRKPILYSFGTSSASWRVRIALAIKKIDYDYKSVNLRAPGGGDQLSAEYKAINPAQQVPSLVIDGVTLVQSLPIIEYLEETRPEIPILPRDPKQRAQARIISEMVNSYIHVLQGRRIDKALVDFGVDTARTADWKRYWIDRGLTTIDEMLQDTAGKFCLGDEITLADLFVIPQVKNAEKFDLDITKYPTCKRVYDNCMNEEVFRVSAAENQPDAPSK